MKKIIETDNNKNLEIKGANNYCCQGKERQVLGRTMLFF